MKSAFIFLCKIEGGFFEGEREERDWKSKIKKEISFFLLQFLFSLFSLQRYNILCLGASRMFALEKGLGPIYALIGKLGFFIAFFYVIKNLKGKH